MKSNRHSKISTKTRRQVLKKLRSSINAACNKREGITYESGFALNEVSNFIPHPKVSTQEKVDLQSCKVLIYDLETTDTVLQDEIVQVSSDKLIAINENLYNIFFLRSQSKHSQIRVLLTLILFHQNQSQKQHHRSQGFAFCKANCICTKIV